MIRKKIYTEELAEEIVTLRENGLSLNLCADYVQISRATLYNWLKKGKSKRSSYHGFYLRMNSAKAKYAMFHQLEMNKANDWRMYRYACHLADPEEYPLNNKNDKLFSDIINKNKKFYMDDFKKAQSQYMTELIELEKAKKEEGNKV